jgi:2-amino-4-hydroxy-6-hydroxymethyldihydropteridine diphosphokinase
MNKTAFIGIGSNLGDRRNNLESAISRIGEETGIIKGISSLYETEPWGFETENYFLNMVVKVNTPLEPKELLESLLVIEKDMGRIRNNKDYSSRIIDLDILFYEDFIIAEGGLTIPHPHIHNRRFVLVPMAEIAPGFVHPVLNKTIISLLGLCHDNSRVIQYEP